jgi:hypothetical protein
MSYLKKLTRWWHQKRGHSRLSNYVVSYDRISFADMYKTFEDESNPNFSITCARKYCTACERNVWLELKRERVWRGED